MPELISSMLIQQCAEDAWALEAERKRIVAYGTLPTEPPTMPDNLLLCAWMDCYGNFQGHEGCIYCLPEQCRMLTGPRTKVDPCKV